MLLLKHSEANCNKRHAKLRLYVSRIGLNIFQMKMHIQHMQMAKTQMSLCIHSLSHGKLQRFFHFVPKYRKKGKEFAFDQCCTGQVNMAIHMRLLLTTAHVQAPTELSIKF